MKNQNGWMGSEKQLSYVLQSFGADQDADGKFIVTGGISSFMGLGDEIIIDDTAFCFINKEKKNINSLLYGTSYGLKATVISCF